MKLIQSVLRRNSLVSAIMLALSLTVVGCASDEKEGDEEVVATGDEAATPPSDSATAPVAAPATPVVDATPAQPTAAPMPGGSVLYVKVAKAQVKEQPNAGARTVGELQRGDHIYVQVEGEWAKFGENKYVSTSSLTEQGVGRTRRKASWSKGN